MGINVQIFFYSPTSHRDSSKMCIIKLLSPQVKYLVISSGYQPNDAFRIGSFPAQVISPVPYT